MKSLLGEILTDSPLSVVCFPFAGGGASVFSNWRNILPDNIAVYPLQLPGREHRITERPYRDMTQLVGDIAEEVQPLVRKKCIFFGHSMGAKIAFEVAKKVKKDTSLELCHFIVSACRAPHIKEPNPIHFLPEQAFVDSLQRFGGTPEEIINNGALMKFFLPMLQADFEIDETYVSAPDIKLQCPITAFGGTEDREATKEDIEPWHNYTDDDFTIKMFSCGHFFIKTLETLVLQELKRIFTQYMDK